MILKNLIKNSSHQLLLPFYHMVTETVPKFVDLLYKPRNISIFKADLETFLTYYKPISLADVIEINNGEKQLTEPSFHLTFDDGLANFYTTIAPLLLEKKIPATVFLNTDFVDNKALFYRYKANLLFQYYNDNYETPNKFAFHIKIHQYNNKLRIEKGENTPSSTTIKEYDVLDFLMNITYENAYLLDELADDLKFSFSDFLKHEKPYLSITQIKELEQQGFTFGAHSTNHPNYGELSLIDQLHQTRSSINWIKKNLNQKHSVFSFPFHDIGISKSFFNEIETNLDISFGTSGFKTDAISFNLQRLDMEKFKGSATSILTKAYIKLGLKKLIGKDIILRTE